MTKKIKIYGQLHQAVMREQSFPTFENNRSGIQNLIQINSKEKIAKRI
jgi:hypothetical protein